MKKMTIYEFKDYVKKQDQNIFKGDGIADIFKEKDQSFAIICKKCGSLNIELIGEDGINYGGYTGYQPGTNTLKCIKCGNAVTVYK